MAAVLNLMVMAYSAMRPPTEAGSLMWIKNGTTPISVTGQVNGQDQILDLSIFNGGIYSGTGEGGNLLSIYSGTSYPYSLASSEGTGDWTVVSRQDSNENQVLAMCFLDSKLYGVTSPGGSLLEESSFTYDPPSLLEFDGVDEWVTKADVYDNQTQVLSFVELASTLYSSTGTKGELLEWDNINMAWTQVAPQSGSITRINGTAVLGGEIYGCASDSTLKKWNGTNAWVAAASLYGAGYKATQLIEWDGKLWALQHATAGTETGRLVHSDGTAWSTSTPSTPTSTDLKFLIPVSTRFFLLAGSAVATVTLREYVGTGTATARSSTANSSVGLSCTAYFDNEIWIGHTNGSICSIGLNGGGSTAWTTRATITGKHPTSMCVHGGELFVGTYTGELYKWNGSSFTLVSDSISSAYSISSMISFNSKLYAGLSAT